MKPATVDIACSCDDKFAQHAAVVLASAVEASAHPASVRFWIITLGLNPQNESLLRKVADAAGAQLTVLKVDARKLHGAPVSGHITLATYLRIFLPELMPADVAQLIYLDADVVVCRDPADLAAIDLGTNLVGAVTNPRFSRWDSIGVKREWGYFNAGILLINLAAWRAEGLQAKMCDLIATRAAVLKQHDQDTLNMTVAGRWLHLDPRWNQQYSSYLLDAKTLGITNAERRELLAAPFIVHYSGSTKPWSFDNDHPLRHLYYRHLQQTPYAGWRPKPSAGKEWLKKLAWIAVPHRLRPAILGW